MEYDDLAKIENLVHNLWDAAALFCLESRSLRYSELHQQMTAWSGRHLSESEMTRARHRLVRRHLIRQGPADNGHNVYSITAAGRVRLGQIRFLMRIAPEFDGRAADDDLNNDVPETGQKPRDGESSDDDRPGQGDGRASDDERDDAD